MRGSVVAALSALAVLAGALGCAVPLPRPAAQVPPIVGQVEFPHSVRKIQASVGYVALKATVYLIDPVLSQAVGSTVSDSSGGFSLGVIGFVPDSGRTYYLEAVKGLADHAAGNPAVRVRTMVRFEGGSWFSMAGAAMTVSRTTTAIAVLASLRGRSQIDPGSLIGTVNVGAPDDSALPPTPDTFTAVPGLTVPEFHTAFGMVDTALKLDQDPFHVIELSQGGGLVLTAAPKLNVTPLSGANVGDEVTLSGGLFDQNPTANQVLFNGVRATVEAVLNDASELKVKVPDGATTGPITVTTASLQYQVPFFLVTPSLAVSVK